MLLGHGLFCVAQWNSEQNGFIIFQHLFRQFSIYQKEIITILIYNSLETGL